MIRYKSKIISISATLAAISAVTQLFHLGYQSPTWGMWIDIVAVSWIIALFMFGISSNLLVSFIGAIVITLFAPETWLGASMKLIASLPISISLYLFAKLFMKNQLNKYSSYKYLFIPLFFGIIIRNLIILPLNYYYAIPIWTKMTPVQAIQAIPWYVIVTFNSVQAIIDVFLAWILTYKFKLRRFSEI